MVVLTADPTTLAAEYTSWLYTAIPASRMQSHDIARLYTLRQWMEVFYRQAKAELGWYAWQVRQDRAILRHWYLVLCAYTFVLLYGLTTITVQKNADVPYSTTVDGLVTLRAELVASLDTSSALVDGVDCR